QGDDDERALEQALLMQGSYLSFVASRTKAVKVLNYLADKGISRESTDHIRAPAGLDLHASSPEEIAVSILAEIVQTRSRKSPIEKPKTGIEEGQQGEDSRRPVAGGQAGPGESARSQLSRNYQEAKAPVKGETVRATDPICGMEIEPLRAKHK